MFLVLGGTKDSREICEKLTGDGFKVLVTTVSQYGGQLAEESGAASVLSEALTSESLISLIVANKIRAIIDATHPFAIQVSQMAIDVCTKNQIPYLRFERPVYAVDEELIHFAADWQEALRVLKDIPGKIFLTTGSKTLPILVPPLKAAGRELLVRVLPQPEVLTQCRDLGLTPKEIMAVQGPFSQEYNRVVYRDYGIEVVVTKESGRQGGTDTKVEAALEQEIPVVIVDRPELEYPAQAGSIEEVLAWVKF